VSGGSDELVITGLAITGIGAEFNCICCRWGINWTFGAGDAFGTAIGGGSFGKFIGTELYTIFN